MALHQREMQVHRTSDMAQDMAVRLYDDIAIGGPWDRPCEICGSEVRAILDFDPNGRGVTFTVYEQCCSVRCTNGWLGVPIIWPRTWS